MRGKIPRRSGDRRATGLRLLTQMSADKPRFEESAAARGGGDP
jgi:hypothetical protein